MNYTTVCWMFYSGQWLRGILTLTYILLIFQEQSQGYPALLSIICQMNQVNNQAILFLINERAIIESLTEHFLVTIQATVLTVLDHHVNWLETQPFTLVKVCLMWLYGLTTCFTIASLKDSCIIYLGAMDLCITHRRGEASSSWHHILHSKIGKTVC